MLLLHTRISRALVWLQFAGKRPSSLENGYRMRQCSPGKRQTVCQRYLVLESTSLHINPDSVLRCGKHTQWAGSGREKVFTLLVFAAGYRRTDHVTEAAHRLIGGDMGAIFADSGEVAKLLVAGT